LQDHVRVEGWGMAVATDVSSIVERAAADCDMERDRGACGRDFVVAPRCRLFVACRQPCIEI
jgi:hypothetical protein